MNRYVNMNYTWLELPYKKPKDQAELNHVMWFELKRHVNVVLFSWLK